MTSAMQMQFPCGAKGEPDFCPDLCRFGRFCKIKDRKTKAAAEEGKEEERTGEEENTADKEEPKVELYY